MTTPLRCLAAIGLALSLVSTPFAAPIVPASDAEVIERLPAASARMQDRELRRRLAADPDNAALAVEVAQRHLAQSRAQGDPRYAGLALAALKPWAQDASAPPAVALMQATLQQHLHDFDGAAKRLEALVARAPQTPSAWLMLATVRRTQGRYDASDAACRGLAANGPALFAQACSAENDALRGRFDAARATLTRIAAAPTLDAATRGWILTTLAETEERAGAWNAAESHWRAALRADSGLYASIAYADFLLLRGRDAEAIERLASLPRSDAVLLRLAIAGTRSGRAGADADAREMRERIALANLRPDTPSFHGREQAMFALWVDRDPARALALARTNVATQREPIDLLLHVQCARAANDAGALAAARALVRDVGLIDARIASIG